MTIQRILVWHMPKQGRRRKKHAKTNTETKLGHKIKNKDCMRLIQVSTCKYEYDKQTNGYIKEITNNRLAQTEVAQVQVQKKGIYWEQNSAVP